MKDEDDWFDGVSDSARDFVRRPRAGRAKLRVLKNALAELSTQFLAARARVLSPIFFRPSSGRQARVHETALRGGQKKIGATRRERAARQLSNTNSRRSTSPATRRKSRADGRFYSQVRKYHHEGGKVYWSMDDTPEETNLINRCDEAQTWEARLAAGSLPK